MGLKTSTVSLDEKIYVVDQLIYDWRKDARSGDPETVRIHTTLKAIFADLQARQQLPTSNALGELRRILDRVLKSKTSLGYDENQLGELAKHVINKWPTISQALEQFGEESRE